MAKSRSGNPVTARAAALLVLSLAYSIGAQAAFPTVPAEFQSSLGVTTKHDIVLQGVVVGSYLSYFPEVVTSDRLPIVILSHGSVVTYDPNNPSNDVFNLPVTGGTCTESSGEYPARKFYCDGTNFPNNLAGEWKQFADENEVLLICPLFDSVNFGSCTGGSNCPSDNKGFAGYRGMLGRHRDTLLNPRMQTDPDAFVNQIIDRFYGAYPSFFDRRALHLGHSAGGQFLSRYIVTHPDRVAAAVLSSAGTVARPNPEVPWQNGQGPQQFYDIAWSNPTSSTTRTMSFSPFRDAWVEIAKSPVMVSVGRCEVQAPLPASCGGTCECAVDGVSQQSCNVDAGTPCMVNSPHGCFCSIAGMETPGWGSYEGQLGVAEEYVANMRANANMSGGDFGIFLNAVEWDGHYPAVGTAQHQAFFVDHLGCRSFYDTLENHRLKGRAVKVGSTYYSSVSGIPTDALGTNGAVSVELRNLALNAYRTTGSCYWNSPKPRAGAQMGMWAANLVQTQFFLLR